MSTTLSRPNRYAATCIRCGGRIAAQAGLLARTDAGSWAADHDGPCPDKPTVIATPVKRVEHDGIYRDDTGTLYRVVHARLGSNRLYAKRVDRDGDRATFTYVPGAIHTLRDDQRLTREQVAALGTEPGGPLYGICVACGSPLTDEDSIARGMGPICAGKY